MKNQYGRWISLLGIPPLTIIFIPFMLVSMFIQIFKVGRRESRLANNPKVNKAFIGSWF